MSQNGQSQSIFCPQFAKLARDMKVPVGLGGGSGSKSSMAGANSSSGPAEDEEDEYPGGLC